MWLVAVISFFSDPGHKFIFRLSFSSVHVGPLFPSTVDDFLRVLHLDFILFDTAGGLDWIRELVFDLRLIGLSGLL